MIGPFLIDEDPSENKDRPISLFHWETFKTASNLNHSSDPFLSESITSFLAVHFHLDSIILIHEMTGQFQNVQTHWISSSVDNDQISKLNFETELPRLS